jgi:fido (protein-threonine AMPylation protein)
MSSARRVEPTIEQVTAAIAEKIGPIELREGALPLLSCVATFLRSNGINVQYDDLLDIAPVSPTGNAATVLPFLCRRIGIRIEQVDENSLETGRSFPILVEEPSGYFLLLLERSDLTFITVLPGISPFPQATTQAAENPDRKYYALKLSAKAGPAFITRYRQARLFLIPWRTEYTGEYSKALVQEVNKAFSAAHRKLHRPAPLPSLTTDAILAAHRQLFPSLTAFYGCYRRINLRRNSVFVDYRFVALALDELLKNLAPRANQRLSEKETIYFSARCFVDFLTIHPFLNANRRIGMLLTNAFAKNQGFDIDWGRMNRSQIYYSVRLACKGHFGHLEQLLYSAMKTL